MARKNDLTNDIIDTLQYWYDAEMGVNLDRKYDLDEGGYHREAEAGRIEAERAGLLRQPRDPELSDSETYYLTQEGRRVMGAPPCEWYVYLRGSGRWSGPHSSRVEAERELRRAQRTVGGPLSIDCEAIDE